MVILCQFPPTVILSWMKLQDLLQVMTEQPIISK